MKSKQTSQLTSGKTKAAGKDGGKVNLVKKSSLKLRANAYKPIANRTRDKSPKEIKTSIVTSNKSKLLKERTNGSKPKNSPQKQSVDSKNKSRIQKSKPVKSKSAKQKEKLKRLTSSNSFLDFWGAKVMGKREASLNASIRVNIMYEKLAPLKSQAKLPSKKVDSVCPTDKEESDKDKVQNKPETGSEEKKNKSNPKEGSKPKSSESLKTQKSSNKISAVKSNSKTEINQAADKWKKRKAADTKDDKDEPASKVRKTSQVKSKSKIVVKKKKKKKTFPSGHQLSNIIEKSPRQASLIAKAMIAMEQEEECVVVESAARTRVFDWTELRTCTQNQRRTMSWKAGLGNAKKVDVVKDAEAAAVQKDETMEVDVSGQCESIEDNSILRTLHQVGDSRILKEYLRAQKEDFQGLIDVEKCSTPEKTKILTPSPKKIVTPVLEDKPEKIASPIKPQSCRVATPIPQLPIGHRTSHMTSYIHHPIPQPVYSQQHAHTQPIKVPPSYTSPAYIYQYAMDRQQGMFVPSSPSPVPYGVTNNDLTSEFSSTYTLSPMGALSLRRGSINPYNTSLHLPVQHIAGFNYPSYYSAPLQGLSQPSASALQALHQRFPLVQPQSVLHALPQEMSSINSYPAGYQSYPQMSGLNQDTSCMPPPPPPPAHTHRPTSIGPQVSHQPPASPMESLRSMNPIGVQPIVNSPVLDFSSSSEHQSLSSHRPVAQTPYSKNVYFPTNLGTNTGSPAKYVVSVSGSSMAAPCKKEKEDYPPSNCDVLQKNSACQIDCSPRAANSRRKSAESSDVSDLLHSAHSAMYQIDNMNTEIHQPMSSASSSSSMGKTSPSKVSIAGHASFNASYSVSSILDMPSYKVKPEPDHKMYSISINNNNTISSNNNLYSLNRKPVEIAPVEKVSANSLAPSSTQKGTNCFDLKKEILSKKETQSSIRSQKPIVEQVSVFKKAPVNFVTIKPADRPVAKPPKPSVDFVAIRTQTPFTYSILKNQKPSIEYVVIRPPKPIIDQPVKAQKPVFDHSVLKSQKPPNEITLVTSAKVSASLDKLDKTKGINDVIVIDDTDESSDDEPLAKFVKAKTSDVSDIQVSDKNKTQQQQSSGTLSQKAKVKVSKPLESKHKDESKIKAMKKTEKLGSLGNLKLQNKDKIIGTSKSSESVKKPVVKFKDDISIGTKSLLSVTIDDIALDVKNKCVNKKMPAVSQSKSKKLVKRVKEDPMFLIPLPRTNTNHGWTWVGEGEMRNIPKLTLGREEQVRVHKCYKAMCHSSGEVVSVRDCVILQSDGDGSVPYVARVTCLWENLHGEMMFSMLWYYQPEHTLQGREPEDGEQELFASKHREENSVACIDDKCFVLLFNEYCRLEAETARAEQGVPLPRWRAQLNTISEEDQMFRRPRPPPNACVDNIWFCRYDYDIRKKVVKKPKHKKSNLRYRPPVKVLK
ncbi:uncharacterized protein LOC106062014 [Biomphalaria glabrata]|uniref:Uncharacterized protein LOC106062014 n=1 Tax=Biomphalaria glabrata TaxID=6526 RepID=A0A9U8E7D0_BIOGL|nr:uncharacterized protein LOC106062014 [Biomphalaria glabrata]XP_013075726.2 uncharacterized protein LOC106062014 [Biomphalaria glabrata]